jgi:site-specific recombinase XerC
MSNPSIFPKNWKSGGQSLTKIDWRIQYYFYDPEHPRKKKLCIVKGMNAYKDLKERRDATLLLLNDEIENNLRGYNPILKRFVINEDFKNAELHPNLPFITALEIARRKMRVSESQHKQLKWVTERMRPMAIKMKMADVTIGELSRRQLKNLLDRLDLPDEYYNRFKGYLGSIFRELVEYECCETNIVRDIRKRKTVKREREVLSPEHFKAVLDYLKSKYYTFYRYAKIFSYSGGRSSELFAVRAKDVNIAAQEYKVLIRKGRSEREKTKVILKDALPFWEELLKDAKPDDFIFSKNLEPGPKQIRSYQITKRWYRLVKKSDGIKDAEGNVIKVTADFYSLKHSLLDSLPEDVAQQMAAHTNAATTAIYQVNKEKRQRELLKELDLRLN